MEEEEEGTMVSNNIYRFQPAEVRASYQFFLQGHSLLFN
jgi:hypothetical protein